MSRWRYSTQQEKPLLIVAVLARKSNLFTNRKTSRGVETALAYRKASTMFVNHEFRKRGVIHRQSDGHLGTQHAETLKRISRLRDLGRHQRRRRCVLASPGTRALLSIDTESLVRSIPPAESRFQAALLLAGARFHLSGGSAAAGFAPTALRIGEHSAAPDLG